MKNRHIKILDILAHRKRIEVNELADLLEVSQVTIRKDLTELEKDGLLIREHGFAVLNESEDINKRLSLNIKKKQRIAKEAAKLVRDNETIIIESGSCCTLFAKEIAETKKNVTIITNSAFLADYIHALDNVHVILLGGEYQNEAQVIVGALAKENLKHFNVDKTFIGIDGYTEETGFTGNNFERVDIVRSMINQSDKTIILSDSSKFGRKSLINLLPPRKITMVITDQDIDNDHKEILINEGITVIDV